MNLESKIRNRLRIGFVSGFILGLSLLVAVMLGALMSFSFYAGEYDFLVGIVGFAFFIAGYGLYQYGGSAIPQIVAEVEVALQEAKGEQNLTQTKKRDN